MPPVGGNGARLEALWPQMILATWGVGFRATEGMALVSLANTMYPSGFSAVMHPEREGALVCRRDFLDGRNRLWRCGVLRDLDRRRPSSCRFRKAGRYTPQFDTFL